jgi:diamine N-acetyltransferase
MESVFLRSLELDDLDRTLKWHNDPELYRTLTGVFRYVSRSTEEEWLRKKQASLPQEVNLAICLKSNSLHIGNIYIRNIDWISRNGELWIFIGETKHRSKGYGQSAIRQLIKYAFKDLGLMRLHLLVLADNKKAVRAYEKCGFVREGKLTKHFFKGGKFKDALVMGLLSEMLH